jgi:hypothetical protein
MNSQNPDLSSKEFSVDSPSLAATPVPEASGTNFDRIASDPLNMARGNQGGGGSGSQQDNTGSQIGKTVGSIGGSLVGGPIGGVIGGALGDIFGGLFAAGGPVGTYPDDGFTGSRPLPGDKAQSFAEGGQPSNEVISRDDPKFDSKSYIEPPNKDYFNALALGYLTGALHQEKYGGTPDTLKDAAAEIKQHLNSASTPGGMASGGNVGPDQALAQAALSKSLGLPPSGQTTLENPQTQSQQVPTNTANAVTAQPQMAPVPPTAPATTQNQLQLTPKGFASPREQYSRAAAPQGRGFAAGGPDNSQPPLQPGQAFQGDGSVKGPGGPQDDAIPAKLSNGEFVFSEPAVQFFGVDKLTQMNEKGKQGFMQAMQQVQGNQGQQPGPPGAPPQAAPQGMMMPPQAQQAPPQPAMAKGGIPNSVTMRKGSGYAGL